MMQLEKVGIQFYMVFSLYLKFIGKYVIVTSENSGDQHASQIAQLFYKKKHK